MFLRRLPVIGHALNLPGIRSVSIHYKSFKLLYLVLRFLMHYQMTPHLQRDLSIMTLTGSRCIIIIIIIIIIQFYPLCCCYYYYYYEILNNYYFLAFSIMIYNSYIPSIKGCSIFFLNSDIHLHDSS